MLTLGAALGESLPLVAVILYPKQFSILVRPQEVKRDTLYVIKMVICLKFPNIRLESSAVSLPLSYQDGKGTME